MIEQTRAALAEPVVPKVDWLLEFEQWLSREMPAGTVISDPLWWAPRIARAAISRFLDSPEPIRAALAEPVGEGRPAPAPAEGEVAKLVRWLRRSAGCADESQMDLRAAELLEQRHPAPVPVASDTYFEFVISDADDCTQAGGIAPTYAQALSEGQHYLAQYLQDGPHTLELRRVEVLPPGALPVPDDAPVPLPDDAQVIEPTEHTLLVPVLVPVPVSERLPSAEDCDAEGRCWWWDGEWGLVEQRFTDYHATHWLPATALPLPQGEVQP